MTTPRITLWCAVSLTLISVVGCSKEAENAVMMRRSCLTQLGVSYQAFLKENNRVPSGIDELATFVEENSQGKVVKESAKRLREGDILMLMDIVLRKNGNGEELDILGYEAAVPGSGGYVITSGGTVELLNAKQFTEYKEVPVELPAGGDEETSNE